MPSIHMMANEKNAAAGISKKRDMRVVKTERALIKAMLALLKRRNFGLITVNDLCKEASVSRTTFYKHFTDKYDLLKHYLDVVSGEVAAAAYSYPEMEAKINLFVRDNSRIVTNIVEYAGSETLDLLRDFMATIIILLVDENDSGPPGLRRRVLFDFCAGGMLNSLLWQVKHNFPRHSQLMNPYFARMIKMLVEWGKQTSLNQRSSN